MFAFIGQYLQLLSTQVRLHKLSVFAIWGNTQSTQVNILFGQNLQLGSVHSNVH